MKKYIIEHYPVSGFYIAGIKRWWPFRYLTIYSNATPDIGRRQFATRFTTMRAAEDAIRSYHEIRYKATMVSFDAVINHDRLVRKKEITIAKIKK